MSCSKTSATEEKRHELSSGTTLWTRKDPSVSTASGEPEAEVGGLKVAGVGPGAREVGGVRDEVGEERAGDGRELELDVTGFRKGDDDEGGLFDLDTPEVSAVSLTMICSPGERPRLESGSSGTTVRVRGG